MALEIPSPDTQWRLIVQLIGILVSVFAVWLATFFNGRAVDKRDERRLRLALRLELDFFADEVEQSIDTPTDPVRFAPDRFDARQFPAFSSNANMMALLSKEEAKILYTTYSEIFLLGGQPKKGGGGVVCVDISKTKLREMASKTKAASDALKRK